MTAQIELTLEDLARLEAAEIVAAEEPSVMEVDDIVQAISQANGGVAEETSDEVSDQAPAPAQETSKFSDLIDAVTGQQTQDMIAACSTAFASRAQYEREKNPNTEPMQQKLSKALARHQAFAVSKVLVAANANPEYVNQHENANARRNIYAIEKLPDLAGAALGSMIGNAINRAILKSMVRCMDMQLPFTGEIAKAAASDKIACPVHYQPYMSRHTVSEGTASTQASSTMTALIAIGAVTNIGTKKDTTYKFTDTPIAKAIIETVRMKHLSYVSALAA